VALKNKLNQGWVGALVGMLLAVVPGCALRLFEFPLATKLQNLSYDLTFLARPMSQPDEVVVVYMDDASYQDLKQPYTAPWDRSLHARLLKRLTAEKARAVVFDIVFSDPGPNPEADKEFANAIKENGNVILAADLVPVPSGYETRVGDRLIRPFELFDQAARGAGMSQLKQDADFEVRQHLHHARMDPIVESLSWATAKLVDAPVTRNATNRFARKWVNYYGPSRTLPSHSYYELLYPEVVLPGTFSNKVVFVGAHLLTYNAGEKKDEFTNPFAARGFMTGIGGFMAGVEVHASIFLNLLRGDWLTRLPLTSELVLIVLCGILAGAGLTFLRPFAATSVAILSAILVFAIAFLALWRGRVWFPWLIVVAAQIPSALLWSVVFNSVQLIVQKRLLEQSLALYLSPKRVKQFVKRRDLLKPGAEKQLLTIIFSDIENFTAISEGMDSDDLAALMNRYFETAVSHCIHKTDGTVVKYIGDAIFAFWNAPEQQVDHQERACRAALLFRDQVVSFSKGGKSFTLRTRIGIHTGVANVGNFGSATRIDYTAIGESINLASRMEGLNKHLGTNVLITRETKEGNGGRFVTRAVGYFRLKGFERVVEVHELLDEAGQMEATRPWREAFAEALHDFQKKRFEAAEAGFRRTQELHPDDGPSGFYLARIAEFRGNPPGDDWAGEIDLKEK
jgi:adenylate cyclase